MPTQDTPNPQKERLPFIKSTTALAAALLVGVNAALLCAKPLASVNPDALPSAHTWVWWATKEFQQMKKAPDVVLVGSSLLMHPICRVDADLHNQQLNYMTHHRSNYIEKQMQANGLDIGACYNFGLPGAMVSDDYMVARAMLKQEHKPKVMVMCLGMRDFMDNCMRCIGATPAFKFFSRYTPIDDLADVAFPQIWQRADYFAKKASYLWDKKLDLQVLLAEQIKSVVAPVCNENFGKSRLGEANDSLANSDFGREEMDYFPVPPHPKFLGWTDNSEEYKKRYRNTNDSLFEVQHEFLRKTCVLAKERGIEILFVNMPLPPENHALMPAGAYEHYLSSLKEVANEFAFPVLDLDGRPDFRHEDYYDFAHMNGDGGKKFADAIVQTLIGEPKLATALSAQTDRPIASTGRNPR